MNAVSSLNDEINEFLHRDNQFTKVLIHLESKLGIDRYYIVVGLTGIFSLYLVLSSFAELICNLIGAVYPAYASIKAIESGDKNDDTQWLTYWVVFGVFTVFEFASDTIFSWFPLYWLVKVIFLLYLYLPFTLGAQKLYQGYIRPFVLKYQSAIDSRLNGAAGKVIEQMQHTITAEPEPEWNSHNLLD